MLLGPQGSARLIVVRHPEVTGGDRALALGRADAELTRRGRHHTLEVLRALAPLQIDRFFSSPATHCTAVADALAKDRGQSVETDARLHDQDLGEWQGRSWTELQQSEAPLVREFFADYAMVAPPGGETLTDAVDRALGWWQETSENLEDRTALVVGAAPLLSGLAARLIGLSLRRAPALTLPAAAFGILDVYRDGAVVRTWHPEVLGE